MGEGFMIAQNNRVFITGTSGTGKSWFSFWLLNLYVTLRKKRYIIYLTDNELDYNNPDIMPASLRPINMDFKNIYIGAGEAKRRYNWSQILRRFPRLYVSIGDLNDKEMVSLVNDLSSAVWEVKESLLMIDEAWQFLNHVNPPERYERVIRGGRKFGVDAVAISQRVVDIYPKILSLYNVIVSFRLVEENDVKRIKRYFSPKNANRIETLKQGHFVVKDTDKGAEESWNTFDFKKRGWL